MLFPLSLYRVCALSVLLCLSACAGPALLRAQDKGEQKPIGNHTLTIVVSPRHPRMLISKHERGVFSHPNPSEEERRSANARGLALESMLARELPRQLNDRLAPYVNHDGHPDNGLTLVLERITVDTDGSVDVAVAAVLQARGAQAGWLRAVGASASRFGSDSGLARDCSEAIVSQLQASGLLR
ncbi:hypothetical protein H3H36_04280 [Duganella sp. FT3S]|uniref:DUF4410 domain-containing protein n=1 Tax=Rugamonas fusca TaxID=2758568 RepID=A0A7W2I5R9_9BURK|nr:hypothetical protein [Rugamonas fusca]MBA5604578.1 hypothetical protein [Rugamonas fusca]